VRIGNRVCVSVTTAVDNDGAIVGCAGEVYLL